jgi:hypothetical protein
MMEDTVAEDFQNWWNVVNWAEVERLRGWPPLILLSSSGRR